MRLMKTPMLPGILNSGDDDMGELGFILRSLVECPFVSS